MNSNNSKTSELDKNLSPEELAEWNAIYASYRSGSLLSGEVTGIDSYNIGGDGNILAVVVIPYRVKILIPEKQLWEDFDNIPKSITRNLLGARIDFIIQNIDRDNNVCTASRIAAARLKRKKTPKIGDNVTCNILAVGQKKILVESNGFDVRLTQRNLCYSMASDFRLKYSTGQTLPAVVTEIEDNKMVISVRDAKPHPFIGLQKRHPVNSRRTSVITKKYNGMIFCKLEDDYDCLCNYSAFQNDNDFQVGDKVIIVIKEYNDKQKRVFGVIVSKWN